MNAYELGMLLAAQEDEAARAALAEYVALGSDPFSDGCNP